MGGAERVAVSIAGSANPDIEYHVVELIRTRSEFTSAFIAELEAGGADDTQHVSVDGAEEDGQEGGTLFYKPWRECGDIPVSARQLPARVRAVPSADIQRGGAGRSEKV